jgi:predicted nucleotidyltransferase
MGTRKARAPRRATKRPPDSLRRIGIADALFTKGQQRVLGLLFGNPARSYYAKEIIGLAAAGSGSIQRELARLEAAGLVSVEFIGKQKHYRANAASPVFESLMDLIVKTSGLADVLRAALSPVGGAIEAAFVYGSVAKRTENASSDIDLLVISETLTYADVFSALEDASARLRRTVNPTIYSRAELRRRQARQNAFVSRVLEQPKIWVIGSENDLAAR